MGEYEYNEYYPEFEDDTPTYEEPVQEENQEVVVMDPEEQTEDDSITKDLLEILKSVTGQNNEQSEEVSSGDSQVNEEDNINDEVIENEDTQIITTDYSELLEDIKNEVTNGNAAIREQNLLLSQSIDANQPTSSVDSLSVTNLLLVLIFSLLLVELILKLIRGLF